MVLTLTTSTTTKLAAHEDEPRDMRMFFFYALVGSPNAAKPMCFRRAKERHSELLAMLDEPDDAIRLESRSSRESKHKGNLLDTFETTKENCTRRHWR